MADTAGEQPEFPDELVAHELIGDDTTYDVRMDETGMVLDLGGVPDAKIDARAGGTKPIARPITDHDVAELARVEQELLARWPETRLDPSLERIALLMDYLGHPERAYKVIHVAGTNGKTSTVRMIESLLRAFGARVGRTLSPHLQSITERVGIDGEPIHPADFVRVYEDIKPYMELVDAQSDHPLSFFEAMIGIAFAAFADAPVDIAVVEVGMGGTWDATNVVHSDVDVITPIGLDHTEYLGDTLTAIAGEKAGIIKHPDSVTVVANQDPEALRVVLERTVEVGSAVARLDQEFGVEEAAVAVGGQTLRLRGLSGTVDNIFLPLSGPHQARNAAVALAAVEAFFGAGADTSLDPDTVRAGFAAALSPGRLERVRSTPTTFIDATHNPHGAQALAAAIDNDFNFSRLIGVVGILGDKDALGVFTALEPVLNEVVITQPSSPRATDAYGLGDIARDVFGEERVHVVEHLPSAYALAVELAEDALEDTGVQSGAGVLITGSVVTAGQARAMFGKEPQ